MENAEQQLRASFEQVELHRYDDAILLTDAKTLVDYILSFPVELSPERLKALQTYLEAEISRTGQFPITKDLGVLVAH